MHRITIDILVVTHMVVVVASVLLGYPMDSFVINPTRMLATHIVQVASSTFPMVARMDLVDHKALELGFP